MAAASPCALVENHATVLTPDGAAIADGGGVVVGSAPDYAREHPDRGEPSSWKVGGKAAKVTHVAPGLDVVAATGPATVTAGDGKAIASVKHGSPAALDAPTLSAVTSTTSQTRHPWTRVDVALAGDPPAGAVALVVFDGTGKTARSWGAVTGNARSVVVFTQNGCEREPDGTRMTSPDEQVELAWLDASGRLSKLSAAVTATAGKP
jgi:hypothetical protein